MTAPPEQIAARAYQRFIERGCEHGHDVEDWLAAEGELATYEVVLLASGASMIEVLRELRALTGMGLREIKDAIDAGPLTIARSAPLADAEAIRDRMQAWGASIEVRRAP
ncbi:MAG TPA: ribosomal protein L7/L12 [Polyangia bacterium]|nr:ribosomal protein L7/L12 [Polyangia bacterium]